MALSAPLPVLAALVLAAAEPARQTYAGEPLPAAAGRSILAHKVLADALPEAKCLDGTPPALYFFGGSDPSRIIMHHEGGGLCKSLDDCAQRATGDLGSSKNYPDTYDLQALVENWGAWYLSDSPQVNPLMANWSKVLVRYCDGGSWTGDKLSPVSHKGQMLHFAGHRNVRAGIRAMLEHMGLGEAVSVVVNGGSAGGLAVYHHVDEYAAAVPGADVVALPDGGFFVEYGSDYPSQMRFVFEAMNASAGLNQGCVASAAEGEEWRCMFAQHAAPHISAPVFALQGRFDSYQTGAILGSHDADLVNEYGANLTGLLRSTVLATRSENAAFVDSCHHHTGGWDSLRAPLGGGGLSQAEAFAAWFAARGLAPRVRLQEAKYPCDACCPCPCGLNGGCLSCCSCVGPIVNFL